jgi:hypothetical protein
MKLSFGTLMIERLIEAQASLRWYESAPRPPRPHHPPPPPPSVRWWTDDTQED